MTQFLRNVLCFYTSSPMKTYYFHIVSFPIRNICNLTVRSVSILYSLKKKIEFHDRKKIRFNDLMIYSKLIIEC